MKQRIISNINVDTPQGLQTAKQIKPKNLLTLAQSNSLMRLMPDSGNKTPVEEFVEYQEFPYKLKSDIYSLKATEKEKEILYNFMKQYGGVLDSQESLMLATMLPFTNYTVDEANAVRKTVAKKQLKKVAEQRTKYIERGLSLGTSKDILLYLWDTQATKQMGYAFSVIHTVAYSIIAVQELNLAFYYDPIYWDTACLIVDSDGIEDESEEEDTEPVIGEDIEFQEEDNEEDEDEESESTDKDEKVKKKSKTIQYGKISTAIGKMKAFGIDVELPNINKSNFTFSPDVKNHKIIYGLKGITRINSEIANTIIENRPYSSFGDFLTKVKAQKLQIINLIKCGAFDEISSIGRENLLRAYITSISDVKSRLTLANMPTLIKRNLIPDEYEFAARLFNFNKYLKKNCKDGEDYFLDEYSLEFYSNNFSADYLRFGYGNGAHIKQKVWEKLYKSSIEIIRPYLKDPKTLEKLNDNIISELWNKYCSGYIPKWEMDSVGFYSGAHELDGLYFDTREIVDFNSLPETPIVVSEFETKDKKKIPIYQLVNIAGTVIEKNKLKNTITLLTQYGVVKVKIYKPQFVKYDKQSFIKNETGKKTITERSWFTRGNKLIIQGMRRGDNFIPKAYKSSPYKPITLISEIDYKNGTVEMRTERDD